LPISDELQDIEEAKARWQKDLPFCGKYISNYYLPCVPAQPTSDWTALDANFPDGRLALSDGDNTHHPEDVFSIRSKDKWVQETVTTSIESRIELERQHGSRHYFKNKDCQEAYGRYMCWLNFPRCNDFQESLGLCQSVCQNLFRVCGFASDLWRCETDVADGEDEDIRALFPGQPFIRNEYHPKTKEPIAVCTPAIKGAASSQYDMKWWSYMLLLVVSIYYGF